MHVQVLQGRKAFERTVNNEDASGLTLVQPDVDQRLNAVLRLTDNPPPDEVDGVVWWKLNTKRPAPRGFAAA